MNVCGVCYLLNKFDIVWIAFSMRLISSSVSLVSSLGCVFLSSMSFFTSVTTPLCIAATSSLPVAIGTTPESIEGESASAVVHVVSVPVNSPHVNFIQVNSVHVVHWTPPVKSSGITGPLSVHHARLAVISSNPTMYNFFIILFII